MMSTTKWTVAAAERARKTVSRLIEGRARSLKGDSLLRFIAGQVMLQSSAPDPLQQLLRFFYVLASLDHHLAQGGLGPSHIADLRSIGQDILHKHGADASRSRLSYLQSELLEREARIEFQNGVHVRAAWRQIKALSATSRIVQVHEASRHLCLGNFRFRIGDAAGARRSFSTALAFGLRDEQRLEAILGLMRAHRLAGDLGAARRTVESTPDLSSNEEVRWQLCLCDAAARRDYKVLLASIDRKGDHRRPRCVLQTWLYVHLSSSFLPPKVFPKLDSLRRAEFGTWLGCSELAQVVRTLERCHESSIPIEDRLDKLGDCLEILPSVEDVETEMLGWACAARWLARAQSWHGAAFALSRYQMLSRALSEGRASDALFALEDLAQRVPQMETQSLAPTEHVDPSDDSGAA